MLDVYSTGRPAVCVHKRLCHLKSAHSIINIYVQEPVTTVDQLAATISTVESVCLYTCKMFIQFQWGLNVDLFPIESV